MPPQLEKNHVVPTAWQDEALARDGVSREVPCSALTSKQTQQRPGECGAHGAQCVRPFVAGAAGVCPLPAATAVDVPGGGASRDSASGSWGTPGRTAGHPPGFALRSHQTGVHRDGLATPAPPGLQSPPATFSAVPLLLFFSLPVCRHLGLHAFYS